MDFRLLGPFEARHDGRLLAVGKRRQERYLLAILLLNAGRVVPTAKLIDLLWDTVPPGSARGVIHTYVGRLRTNLRQYGVRIDTCHDGYLVCPDEHRVDAAEFVTLVRLAGDTNDLARRIVLYDRALALWRGPLLADLAGSGARDGLDAGLDELRLSAIEKRAAACLATGQHDRVADELTAPAADHPTRESMIGHLMLALYRCDRQADALRLYQVTRQALRRELGVEPGADLRALHERILRDDPALRATEPAVHAVRFRDHLLPLSVGGHPALDFCNTNAGWGGPPLPQREWLRGYDTLAVWVGFVDLADDWTVTRLLRQARQEPDEATAVLEEARALRADLYACLTDPTDHRAFAAVARLAETAAKVSVFDRDGDGLGRWRLSPEAGLRLPVYAVARSAAELLADPRRYTVRACPGDGCGWLFLGQGGVRRFCVMGACAAHGVAPRGAPGGAPGEAPRRPSCLAG